MQKCSLEFIFSGSEAPPLTASALALYAVSSCMGLARYSNSFQPPFLQHSAHYRILENNISSKLSMRKNMIVLTSDCDAASTVLWQTLLRTPNTLISLGLLLHNPRNRDKLWLCSPLIVIPSPNYQWSAPRLPDHRSQTIRHRNSSRRPQWLRRYHPCDSVATDIASGSRIAALAT